MYGDNATTKTCLELSLCNYLEAMTAGFGIDNTMLAFVYTLLDITFYNNTPGLSWKTDAWGTGGAVCKHQIDPGNTYPFS